MDEWDDDALTTALRRRANAMDIGDVATAASTVRQRARRRRLARSVAAGAGVVVLVGGGLVAVAALRDGDQLVEAPATQPAIVTAPSTIAATSTTGPPSTTSSATASSPPVTTVVVQTAPGTATTRTTEVIPYSSTGGSIEVEVSPTGLRLVGPPEPASGYTVEVEDDRPDRVRVRFESGDRRSRITVELVDGQPEPQIEES